MAFSARCLGLGVKHLHDVAAFKLGDRKVAVLAPQPFEDSSVLLLRSGLQTLELSRGAIADDHRGNATPRVRLAPISVVALGAASSTLA
jgi:hypothetical protein